MTVCLGAEPCLCIYNCSQHQSLRCSLSNCRDRTPADEANDRTSLNRALDARLVLIIKSRPGDPWTLPESAWQVSEAWCYAHSLGITGTHHIMLLLV